MTRLTTDDISTIAATLQDYDADLVRKTGWTLGQLASEAAALKKDEAKTAISRNRVAVIPMTCGQGIIQGFSQTLAAIADHLGFPSEVTRATDAAGLAEAFEKRVDIVLLSDDQRYIAVNLATRFVVDNGDATGRGFATGLVRMTGGAKENRVLVLGLGPVGQGAAREFIRRGVRITVCEINEKRRQAAALALRSLPNSDVEIAGDLQTALSTHCWILDATPVADVIGSQYVDNKTVIAAPGVPPGVTSAAREILADRLLHDPLQIGTATMLMAALAG